MGGWVGVCARVCTVYTGVYNCHTYPCLHQYIDAYMQVLYCLYIHWHISVYTACIATCIRISGFIRWEVIFAFFASDEEFAKIVKLLL